MKVSKELIRALLDPKTRWDLYKPAIKPIIFQVNLEQVEKENGHCSETIPITTNEVQ